jgi:drug/metabolite transporter (DMT)-like permease
MKYIEKHPMIMIVLSVVGIAMSSIFVRYSQAPSTVTAAYRLLWTVLLLTPVALGKQQNRNEIVSMGAKKLLLSALSGVFLAAHFALWFESLQHTSVASSTTIVCTEVIWVALGYCLFLRGKLSGRAILAIGITLVGSVLIAWSDSGSVGRHLYGDVLALVAAIAVAVYTLIGQHIRKTVSTVPYTYVVYVSCAATLLVCCLARGESLAVTELSAPVVGLLLAVFCTIMGHSVFTWCLKYFSPSFVSASKLCEPVVAAVMAGFLFEEMPKVLQIVGGVLILGGVYYYSRIEGKKQ